MNVVPRAVGSQTYEESRTRHQQGVQEGSEAVQDPSYIARDEQLSNLLKNSQSHLPTMSGYCSYKWTLDEGMSLL